MTDKIILGIITATLLASGCISAETIETDTEVDTDNLRYDLDIQTEVEKHPHLETIEEHTNLLNNSASTICSTIIEDFAEQETNETREELKPRDINLEIYTTDKEKIAECHLEE